MHHLLPSSKYRGSICSLSFVPLDVNKNALLLLGEQEVSEFLTLVSGILLIGNIEFSGNEKVCFDHSILTHCFDSSKADLKDENQLRTVAGLLQIDPIMFRQALTFRSFQGGGRKSSVKIPLTLAQAVENRDAIAKVRCSSTNFPDFLFVIAFSVVIEAALNYTSLC